MDKDRQEAREQVKKLPFGEKIKHYAYYYKLHIALTLVVVLMLGLYVYQRATETEYGLSVSLFSEGFVTIEAEEKAEKLLSSWLDGENSQAELVVTTVPKSSLENLESISTAYTKLDGQLAAGTIQALILDSTAYSYAMSNKEYVEVLPAEHTVKLGENAKKQLGILDDGDYYYLVRKIYESEEDNETAIQKHENAIKILDELKK